jgi:hypothetical protein
MRVSVVTLLFAATVSALPRADPQFFEISPAPSKLPDISVKLPTPTRRRKHKEPTPTVRKKVCECPKPIVPVNQFTASEVRITVSPGKLRMAKSKTPQKSVVLR